MTTTFKCLECGTVDIDVGDGNSELCYECRTGEWHGLFEKEQFDPSVHTVNNVPSDEDDSELGVSSFG